MKCERGCEWVGTVGTLEEHVATCGFTLVPCPKLCKDDKAKIRRVVKKDLDKHLKNDCPNRDFECKSKCGEKGTFTYIAEVHDKLCKKKKLPCPNAGCNKEIQRQNISQHVSKCPHTLIPCKYKGIGCDTELKRSQDLAAHEQDDKIHLHMALETVNSLHQTVKSQQAAIDSVQFVSWEKSKVFVLSEYQKKKEANEEFLFPAFYTHPNGYHMELSVFANGDDDVKDTHVSVYAAILDGEYDAGLKWPFVGEVTVTLLNQLQDKNHFTMKIPFYTDDNICVGGIWGYHSFIPHSTLAHNPVRNTQYLKDDTLYFRVAVEVTGRKRWLTN